MKLNWQKVNEYADNESPESSKKVEKSEDEWKKELPPEVFQVTRKHGTDRAFSGEYCHEYEPGLYACACCGTELFDSTEKFKSGTGWPSFSEPVKEGVIRYQNDQSLAMRRIEVLCNVCDAHLGHVFPDGPEPTGLRYCVNSTSLKLLEAAE